MQHLWLPDVRDSRIKGNTQSGITDTRSVTNFSPQDGMHCCLSSSLALELNRKTEVDILFTSLPKTKRPAVLQVTYAAKIVTRESRYDTDFSFLPAPRSPAASKHSTNLAYTLLFEKVHRLFGTALILKLKALIPTYIRMAESILQ